MTHWYSPTPKNFADNARPPYLAQSGELYAQKELLVFDVRKSEGLDIYQKLTDADIKHNGTRDMFHTIGLAERFFATPLEAYSTKKEKKLSDFAQICKNICAVSKLAIDFNDKLL